MRVKRLREDARVPSYATEGAAGLDLSAALDEPLTLRARGRAAIPTGIAIELPPGTEGQIRPRSGLALEHGVTVLNAPGTIDADYRGEVRVLLVNLSDVDVVIEPADRVAQLVVTAVTRVACEVVPELSDTTRGERGFGSTGRGQP